MTTSRLSRWLREPLLHFALIGAALFFVYGRLNPGVEPGRRIVVTQAVVDDLARQYQARWMRPASQQELANLVEVHVRDEIVYREGVALGLNQDDPVIKRRVRQKFEVMAEEQLASAPPSDADLAAYLAQHATRFTLPARLSFEQVYCDGAAPRAEVERTVAAAKVALARGASPDRFGRPTLLPNEAQDMRMDLVARDFGPEFARQLEQVALAEWTGPVASSMGAHLVRVSTRTPGGLPALDDVRQQVAREWENARRERSRSDSLSQLRAKYEVVIEPDLATVGAPRP